VIAGDVKQRDVKAAHQVLEVVERQIATRDDEVRTYRGQPLAVQGLVDLVSDGEDAQGLGL
jgi:hypothetical protein